jgi:RNA polymerase sigma factor (sigma-70 family)
MNRSGESTCDLSIIGKLQRRLITFESSPERREDAAMEAFVRLWNTKKSFLLAPLSETNYLVCVAKNFLRDEQRRERFLPLLSWETQVNQASPSEEASSPSSHLQTNILLIRQANQSLSEEEQCLLHLYSAGYSCQEIADSWKISEEAVKKRLQRARQRFRIALIRYGYGDPTKQ